MTTNSSTNNKRQVCWCVDVYDKEVKLEQSVETHELDVVNEDEEIVSSIPLCFIGTRLWSYSMIHGRAPDTSQGACGCNMLLIKTTCSQEIF